MDKKIFFNIEKLDKIINQDQKVFIFNKSREGTGHSGFALRFCERTLLKNLLENKVPCAVIHTSYGDTFQDMYRLQDGWKNNTITLEQTEEFDLQASAKIIQYPLYEFKIYGNDTNSILDYIQNFINNKVKYIFITNIEASEPKNLKIIEKIMDIAESTDITFILRPYFYSTKLPKRIEDCKVDFIKDKDSQEITVSCLDKDGNRVYSEPMKHYPNEGMGYIE